MQEVELLRGSLTARTLSAVVRGQLTTTLKAAEEAAVKAEASEQAARQQVEALLRWQCKCKQELLLADSDLD